VLDEQGQPVTDLDSADFQIFDDDKPQPILFFKALPTPGTGKNPPTTLVLFDLLNTFAGQRENSVTLLSHALEPLEQSDSIGLYILTNHADLYPVHALSVPQPAAAQPRETKSQTTLRGLGKPVPCSIRPSKRSMRSGSRITRTRASLQRPRLWPWVTSAMLL